MFTGLIQAVGTIQAVMDTPRGRRIVLDATDLGPSSFEAGESIAVSGVCLSLVRIEPGQRLEFDAVRETISVTSLGDKHPGDAVNLERSLRAGDLLGGHFVQGHVDAVAEVVKVNAVPGDWRIVFSLPDTCRNMIVPKGSIAIDGVSMTIATVDSTTFSVAVIELTREKTTLGGLKIGSRVNIESDILTRTIVNYLQHLDPAALQRMAANPADQIIGATP
ncbi:MAG: riboflavin synthase [Phycisphaerae bacterium]